MVAWRCSLCLRLPRKYRILLVLAILFVLWIVVGTLFYSLFYRGTWTGAESFYYTVQAGLSIGFGLLAETHDGSRMFTVIFIVCGSSFIASALGLFVSLALTRQARWQSSEEHRLYGIALDLGCNGYQGLRAVDLLEFLMQYPRYTRDLLCQLEPDDDSVDDFMDTFRAAPMKFRRIMVQELLRRAVDEIDAFKDGSLTIGEINEIHDDGSFLARSWARVKAQRNNIVIASVFVTWVVVGVVYGVTAERWSFIQALYFSVTTLSTAGLQAVSRGTGNVIFAGFFSLIGVPLYGAAVGILANVIANKYAGAELQESLHAKIERAEIDFMEHLLQDKDKHTVTAAEYMGIQLLRMGLVDRDILAMLQGEFRKLDVDGSGLVPRSAFLAARACSRHATPAAAAAAGDSAAAAAATPADLAAASAEV